MLEYHRPPQFLLCVVLAFCSTLVFGQNIDTIHPVTDSNHLLKVPVADTALRFTNLTPYITLHVDSTIQYPLELNRPGKFFWFLRNAPVGLKIDKDNGTLRFKADKSYFLSGHLVYDKPYPVVLGVQDNKERIDTNFTILFYNTEIIPSKIKPSVSNLLQVDEGDTVSFRLQCDNGSFPIEHISFFANQFFFHL